MRRDRRASRRTRQQWKRWYALIVAGRFSLPARKARALVRITQELMDSCSPNGDGQAVLL